MTYCTALELQILACRGMLARWRLCWSALGKVPLGAEDTDRLLDVAADGIAAARILHDAGIRFSYIRPLREEEMR